MGKLPKDIRNEKGRHRMAKKSTNKSDNIGLGGKILIVFFAILMAASLMLPSFAAIFSSSQSNSSTSEQQSTSVTDVASADAKYTDVVASLEEKYSSDPTDLATLLNLGKDYMTWGVYVRYFGSTDADTSHANELLDKAVKYYDEYLAIKDSNAVRCDKAMCAFYQEDGTSALNQLEELTASAPDYGPAWANLGLLYEASGNTDAAKEAYAKAQETDPDDEYGAKSYAAQRLSVIESAESGDSSDGSGSSDSTSTTGSSATGSQGLSDTLGSLSGTGL